jgi:hypothetical protein
LSVEENIWNDLSSACAANAGCWFLDTRLKNGVNPYFY